jgi:hypothetical protein
MKKHIYHFILLHLFLLIGSPVLSQECILVIQGVRNYPKEAMFNNSSDLFVTGMGATSPAPKITVLRPPGETSNLGATPARTEKNYSDKADLLKKIKEALCDEKCVNVVITFIGHGMGGDGINGAPSNDKDGGMKVGPGNFLLAAEMAKLIDECKKSVKLISSHCYGEAMIKGICDKILNKGLIGVGIASSPWDKESFGTGRDTPTFTYEFLMNFLKDYYLIIGNPNAMADITKNAEDLKKKNEEYNAKIAAENAAHAAKIKECEDMLAKLKADKDAIDAKLKGVNQKIADAEAAKELLEERLELEKELDALKNSKDNKAKNEVKDKLKKNAEALKKLGIKSLPSGKLDKITKDLNKLIDEQNKILTDLNAQKEQLEKDLKAKELAILEKSFALEDLKAIPFKSPIPDHLPVMELVIHEAFKSAKALTKSSMPVEPVAPSVSGPVDMPKTPPTDVKIGDNYFAYYKVIDKKTGKCVVVGYRRDNFGNPIGPIKSIECEIDCSKIKFSYNDNGTDKVVEAIRQEDKKYKYTQDGQPIANHHNHKKLDLILPGQLLEEAYCQVVYNDIPEIVVPNWQLVFSEYDSDQNLLLFHLQQGPRSHQVSMQFLVHEDVLIGIDNFPAYLASSTRRFSLLNPSGDNNGQLGVIIMDDGILGNIQLCDGELPIPVQGQLEADLTRFSVSGPDVQIMPMPDNNSLMIWNMNTSGGILQLEIIGKPFIAFHQIQTLPTQQNQLIWQYQMNHLADADLELFKSTEILAIGPSNNLRKYSVPVSQNTWIDPLPSTGNVLYKIYPVSHNTKYCVPYEGELLDELGRPVCISVDGPSHFDLTERSRLYNSDTQKKLKVYPNPFSDFVNFRYFLNTEQTVVLIIRNTEGKILWRREIVSPPNWNQIKILKSDIQLSGLLMYELQTHTEVHKGKLVYTE